MEPPASTPPPPVVPPTIPEVKPAAVVPKPIISSLPKPPPKVNPFIYLGIPQWVFDFRPSVPSRNMSIFLTVTIGLTSAYFYDRRECDRLKKEYIDRVKWMSEGKLETGELARRVRVFGARVPDDGELERSSKWFKKYIKPILVASATDYTLTTGTNPGGLGRTILSEIRARRIAEASRDPNLQKDAAYGPRGVNPSAVLEERDAAYEAKELDGGIILLGRGALKEYLWAVRKGYGQEIDLREEARLEGLGLGSSEKRKDGRWEREEEIMVRELEREDEQNPNAPFNLPEPVGLEGVQAEEPVTPIQPNIYAPYRALTMPQPSLNPPTLSTTSTTPSDDTRPLVLPATPVPAQPPLLLVPFTYPFGVRTWPSKLAHFWNHRSDVKLGGECALMIIEAQSRPMESPYLRNDANALQGILDENLVEEVRLGMHKELTMEEESPKTGSNDLDFRHDPDESSSRFKKSYRTLPSNHEYARRNYYDVELPPRLTQARELANGRTPTKAEDKYAPKIESELRKERLEKELKWRRELEGWAVQRGGAGVAWEESWGSGVGSENAFRIFRKPTEAESDEFSRARADWIQERKIKEAALDDRDAVLVE